MPMDFGLVPNIPKIKKDIEDSLKEAWDDAWTLAVCSPFSSLTGVPQDSQLKSCATWMQMLTQGVMATKRMLGTPDPTYYKRTMTVKDQMTDFYESFTRLEREKEIYAPLLVETDLA